MENKLDKKAIEKILSSRLGDKEYSLKDIPNPSLLKDVKKASQRVVKAIQNNEKITVVGDYDVDGVTSTSIAKLFFQDINYPLECIIPNRFTDGYGVNAKILQRVDADVVFTVDNGISAVEAAQICKDRGIDLIITDHHTVGDIVPDAFAIVNPKQKDCTYPFKEICGAQVAWLFFAQIKNDLGLNINMSSYLDLLALAIIADIMPLININRAMVKAGLKRLQQGHRPSTQIISEFINKSKISSEDIAFGIAPRINSAGRLKDASIALNFLTAQNLHEAFIGFENLSNLNEQRKDTEATCTESAIYDVNEDDKIIVVASDDWHEGVVGIVASRLVNRFEKPAIVLSVDGEIAKGSARSLGGVNIFNLIKESSSKLIKFGGHKMAAGLSINVDDLDEFRKEINKNAKKLDEKDFLPLDTHLGEIESSEIDFELLELFDKFEPFGEANPRPKFITKEAHVLGVKYFGKEQNHSRINLKFNLQDRMSHDIIAFKNIYEVEDNRKIKCVFSINKNEFNSKISIQLLADKIY